MHAVDINLPHTKELPQAPSTDNPRDFFTKQALMRLIEHSKVFPRYHAVNFKTQDKLDTLFWIEYMIGKFVYGDYMARIATPKAEIMNLIAQNVNILSFKRNKRNHAKVNDVIKRTGRNFWLILMDEDSENNTDLNSISILIHSETHGLFNQEQLIEFLNVNHVNDKKTNDLKINQNVETYDFDVLQAGALSRAKHRVVKMARNLIAPAKQSMSRTGTFTRRHVRPEEYVNDETFRYENEYRIDKLNEIVKAKPPTTEKTKHVFKSAYDKALKFFDITSSARKKRRANTLLRKFGGSSTSNNDASNNDHDFLLTD